MADPAAAGSLCHPLREDVENIKLQNILLLILNKKHNILVL